MDPSETRTASLATSIHTSTATSRCTAGSASTNPVLFILAILIILASKVAGHIGIDRWLLPALGTPWSSHISIRWSSVVVEDPGCDGG